MAKPWIMLVSDTSVDASTSANNGGGATKAWWDAGGLVGEITESGGAPIAGCTVGTYNSVSGVLTGDDGDFTGVEVGMIARVVSGTNATPGWYEITACDGTTITIAGAGTTDATGNWVVNVGGAIPWATAIGSAAAGWWNYCKGGYTLTRSAGDSQTNAGTVTDPIRFVGCDSNYVPITPTRTNGNGPLVTTGWLTIAYDATYSAYMKGYTSLECIKITGSRNGDLLSSAGSFNIWRSCSVTNSNTGSSTLCIVSAPYGYTIDCDGTNSGASGAHTVFSQASYTITYGCRAQNDSSNAAAACFKATSYSPILFPTCVKGKVGINILGDGHPLVVNPTFYNLTYGIQSANTSITMPIVLINGMATDLTNVANCLYASGHQLWEINTRVRDAGEPAGFAEVMSIGRITGSGSAATDYEDAVNGDLRIKTANNGKGAGIPRYLDCGSPQREEPAGSAVDLPEPQIIGG